MLNPTHLSKTGLFCKTAMAFCRFGIISGTSPVRPRHSAENEIPNYYKVF